MTLENSIYILCIGTYIYIFFQIIIKKIRINNSILLTNIYLSKHPILNKYIYDIYVYIYIYIYISNSPLRGSRT